MKIPERYVCEYQDSSGRRLPRLPRTKTNGLGARGRYWVGVVVTDHVTLGFSPNSKPSLTMESQLSKP